jgi:hypothetical protein
VLVAELLKLLLGNLIRQPCRIVGGLRVTQAAQKVDEPLPFVCHEPTLVPPTNRSQPSTTLQIAEPDQVEQRKP